MVRSNLKVLAKFGLCSNCSQKLDECSLVPARKTFATARMLGFSLKFPALSCKHNLKHWGNMVRHECFWKGFLVLLTFIEAERLSSVSGSRITLREAFRL